MWDAKLAATGEQFGRARAALVERVEPVRRRGLRASWPATGRRSSLGYDPPWRRDGLAAALAAARADDVRRGVSTVGPAP